MPPRFRDARCTASIPSSWSARKRFLHARQSTSGRRSARRARTPPRCAGGDDRAVEALDVVALAHDALPPERLQVVLELDAERAVVPEAVDAAVDLARLEDEAAPRAERHEVVHADVGALGGADMRARRPSLVARLAAEGRPAEAGVFREPPEVSMRDGPRGLETGRGSSRARSRNPRLRSSTPTWKRWKRSSRRSASSSAAGGSARRSIRSSGRLAPCSSARSVPRWTGTPASPARAHAAQTGPPSGDVERDRARALERRGRSARSGGARGAGRAPPARAARAACVGRGGRARAVSSAASASVANAKSRCASRRAPPSGASRSSSSSR